MYNVWIVQDNITNKQTISPTSKFHPSELFKPLDTSVGTTVAILGQFPDIQHQLGTLS